MTTRHGRSSQKPQGISRVNAKTIPSHNADTGGNIFPALEFVRRFDQLQRGSETVLLQYNHKYFLVDESDY